MKLVIFGGTTEGRTLSCRLADLGAEVVVCVATPYGAEIQGETAGITVLTGPKSQGEKEALLQGARLCIDATHPYAREIKSHLRAACQTVGVEYLRLLRPESETVGTVVETAAAAAAYLAHRPGNILLTTGGKELAAYAALGTERLYPRILPTHEGLSLCEGLGIPHCNILAIQGPFSQELNEAFIRQYAIAFVVTKDGGVAGGFAEKVAAATATGVELVLLRRPEEQGDDLERVLQRCKELIKWK